MKLDKVMKIANSHPGIALLAERDKVVNILNEHCVSHFSRMVDLLGQAHRILDNLPTDGSCDVVGEDNRPQVEVEVLEAAIKELLAEVREVRIT